MVAFCVGDAYSRVVSEDDGAIPVPASSRTDVTLVTHDALFRVVREVRDAWFSLGTRRVVFDLLVAVPHTWASE